MEPGMTGYLRIDLGGNPRKGTPSYESKVRVRTKGMLVRVVEITAANVHVWAMAQSGDNLECSFPLSRVLGFDEVQP